jgi:HlyD family secretion protein/adhesin transport system membrane fusion protein
VQSDYEQVTIRLILLKLQIARLHSFLSGDLTEFNRISKKYPDISAAQHDILEGMLASQNREQGVLQQQLVQKQKQEDILQRELVTAQKGLKIAKISFETQKELYDERLVSETTYFAVLRDMNEQQGKVDTLQIRIHQARNAIHEYEWRLQSIDSDSRDKALQQIETLEREQAETVELAKKLQKQVERLAIRSPVDGVVKGLEFHTIGGVIAPGHKLMEIVPAGKEIFAEVKISPNDIGHIKPGMPVIIKVTSYDSSRYGHIDGKVTSLSATTFTSEKGQSYYKGVITLAKNYVGNIPGQNHVLPGMIINGDIITGQKSLLDYLLKPVHKALNSSFGER